MKDSLTLPFLGRSIPRVWLITSIGWGSRITTAVLQLLVVRILGKTLGADGYGVFAALIGFAGWFQLADFGVPYSLQNFISERRAKNESYDELINIGFFLILAFVLVISILLFILGPLVAHQLLGKFTFLSPNEQVSAFLTMGFLALLTALASLMYRIWFAQHRGSLSYLLPAISTVFSVLGVYLVSKIQPSNLLTWSIIAYFAPIGILPMVALTKTTITTMIRHPISIGMVRPLFDRSIQFWFNAVLSAVVLQLDYVVLSQTLEADKIAIYSITGRFFNLLIFFYSALLMAWSPVCAEALAKSKWKNILHQGYRYIGFGMLMVLVSSVLMLLLKDQIFGFLLPDHRLTIPSTVILLMMVYTMVRVWTDTWTTIMLSVNDIRGSLIVVPFQAGLNIVFQVAGAHYFGLQGLIAGLVGCFALTCGWFIPWRVLKRASAARGTETI